MDENKKNIDWEAIEIEYVTTKTTYEAISKKYNIHKNTIYEYAKKHNWKEKKKKHRENIVTRATEITAKKKGRQLANVEKAVVKCGQMANRMIKTAEKKAKEAEKDENVKCEFTPSDLKDLVTALKGVTELIRDLFEIPSTDQIEERAIKREKIALEREKLNLVKGNGGKVTIEVTGCTDEERTAFGQ